VNDIGNSRELAIAAQEECRRLLENPDRSRDEDREMLVAAHASLDQWQKDGTFVEEQRSNLLIARAYIALGLIEPALEFGRRTMEITAKHQEELADIDRAYAKELAARAWALAGNLERARAHHADAEMLGEAIRDDSDRQAFFVQFKAEPWFRLSQSLQDDS